MNLEEIFSGRRRQPTLAEKLGSQVDQLRREIGDITTVLSRDAQHTANEWGHEAARQGAWLAGVASRKAIKGADAVRRDPLPVVAVIGTALLLAHLLSRR